VKLMGRPVIGRLLSAFADWRYIGAMIIEPVSSTSPLDAYRAAVAASRRSPEVAPDARDIAAQENDSLRIAESVSGASPAYLRGPDGQAVSVGVGTRVNIVPIRGDPQGSLERATSEISRAYSGSPTPVDLRNAAEAYRIAAAAADDLALRQQAGGARTLDISV
jgi:hypothetical protein